MAVSITLQLTQSSSAGLLTILDTTGAYSSNNTGGWGSPNESVSAVTTVQISGVFRPYPSTSAYIRIASTELMPLPTALPYNLWQSFQLTPLLLGLPTPNFQDGIITLLYTVNTASNVYTATIQQEITPNSDCCLGNNLATLDPFCKDCGQIKDVFGNAFLTLMASKASAGCSQNNSSLDDLAAFNAYLNCTNCGC